MKLQPERIAVIITMIALMPGTGWAQELLDPSAVEPPPAELVLPEAVRVRLEPLRKQIEVRADKMRGLYDKNHWATLKTAFEKNTVDSLAHQYISSWSGNGLYLVWAYSCPGFYEHHIGALEDSIRHAERIGGLPTTDLKYLERGVAVWLQQELVLSRLLVEYTDHLAKRARYLGEAMRIQAHPKFYLYNDPEHKKEWAPAAERKSKEADKLIEPVAELKRQIEEAGAKRVFSAINAENRLAIPEVNNKSAEMDLSYAGNRIDPPSEFPSAEESTDDPSDDTLNKVLALAKARHEDMLQKSWVPQELPSASSTDPDTGITTTSQKNPDGSRTVTRTDRDGNFLLTETIPLSDKGTAFASSTDPESGITTNSVRQPDGSRLITQIDREGNVISSELTPPEGMRRAIASTTDPATGVTTTVETMPDGSRVTTHSVAAQDDETGVSRFVAADDRGHRSDTVVDAEGLRSMEVKPDGRTVATDVSPDGSIAITEKRPDGSTTTIHRTPDGVVVEQNFEADGTPVGTIIRPSDGEEIRENREGTIARSNTEGGRTTETMIGPDGNLRTVTRDETGEIVAETNTSINPGSAKPPGQEYFEKVLKGGDWDELPPSLKNRYADSEQQLRNNAEMETLRQSQEDERERVAEESRKFSEGLQAETDAELAAIRREQEGADRKVAERIAREERQRQIDESYDKAAELRKQHADAVKRDDKAEALRIEQEQDDHHQASMEILALNEEEQRAIARKDELRRKLHDELIRPAWNDADNLAENDWSQGLKEDITKGTKHVFVGSALQQDTAATTRSANRLLAAAEAKEERFRAKLNHPETTQEEREILGNMLAMSGVQREGAAEHLASNARLTAAGYGVDALMLASGGTLAKGATALASKAPTLQTTVAQMAGSGAVGVTRRVAGERAASALQQGATRFADAASAAGSRALQSGPGKVLTRDLRTGAQAESVWLKGVIEESAKGMVIDTGYQLATTGTVDPTEVVVGGLAGGVLGSTLSSASKAIRGTPRPSTAGPAPAVADAAKSAPATQPKPAPEIARLPDMPTPAPRKPEIVHPPKQPAPPAPKPAPEIVRQPDMPTPAPRKPEIVYPPTRPVPPAPKPAPETATLTAEDSPPPRDPTSRVHRSPDATYRPPDLSQNQLRKAVPRDEKPRFDRSVEVMDRLIQAEPALANIDRDAVVPGLFMRSGNPQLTPEAVAVAALRHQAPKVPITAGTLAKAAGVSPAQAETALRSAEHVLNPPWLQEAAAARGAKAADAGRMARSLADTNPLPGPKHPQQPATLTRPLTERLVPERMKTDIARNPETKPAAENPTDPKPKPVVEEFDPTAPDTSDASAVAPARAKPEGLPPSVEEFDPTKDSDGAGRPSKSPPRTRDEKVSKAEAERVLRDWKKGQVSRDRKAAAARADRQQLLDDAVKTGQFKDAPGISGITARPMRNANDGSLPQRKLMPGDSEYLDNIMNNRVTSARHTDGRLMDPGQPVIFNVKKRIQNPDGSESIENQIIGPLLPSQNKVAAHVINNYVEEILKSPPNTFPISRSAPLEKMQVFADGNLGPGHHRLVASVIASRLTGRPLYGHPNAIIPDDAILFPPRTAASGILDHALAESGKGTWRIGVAPPLPDVRPEIVGKSRKRAVELRRQAAEAQNAGLAQEADQLSRQAAHMDWQADMLEPGMKVRPDTAGAAGAVESRRTQLEQLNAVPAANRTPEVRLQIAQLNRELQRIEPDPAKYKRAMAEEIRREAADNPVQAYHLNHQADTLDIAAGPQLE